ncbi:MAG: DUF1641 domain-containing protein [Sulfolobaceae archaeon]|nr:DUF1641 domain-containing protein [Sulfolobaceae archaeon]
METVNLEKLVEKLDQKKIDELSEFLDLLPTVNDVLKKVNELKESGALDVLVNSAYILKTLKDMINDEVVTGLGEMTSAYIELGKELADPKIYNNLLELLENVEGLVEVSRKLSVMKNDGTLDVLVNSAYILKTLKDMINDEALEHVSTYISQFLEAYPKAIDFLNMALREVPYRMVKAITSEETKKSLENPPQLRLLDVLRMFNDPDVQRGFGVLFTLIKAIGKEYSSK